jgi:hypothetical protein
LYRVPFPGLPHIYFLFTVWLTNERVGVFLARRSVQHLLILFLFFCSLLYSQALHYICLQIMWNLSKPNLIGTKCCV